MGIFCSGGILMNIEQLSLLITDAAPIHGIDSDGRIDFKVEATEVQRSTARAVMDANLPDLIVQHIPPPPD
jgi:hypothetical protein